MGVGDEGDDGLKRGGWKKDLAMWLFICNFAFSKKKRQMQSGNDTSLFATSGDYRKLVCYQKSVVVYDLTYRF